MLAELPYWNAIRIDVDDERLIYERIHGLHQLHNFAFVRKRLLADLRLALDLDGYDLAELVGVHDDRNIVCKLRSRVHRQRRPTVA